MKAAVGIMVIALTLCGACMDASGQRVSMQEWWESRTGHADKDRELADARAAHHQNSPAQTPSSSPTDRSAPGESSASTPAAGATPNQVHEPSPNAVHAEGLILDNEIIKVADVLEPIQSRLPALADELTPEMYWRKVADLVRQCIVESVAQHLVWKKASSQLSEELKPQLEKAVEKMEKERINREFGGRETMYAKYLGKHGKSREEVRERLRRGVLIDSYLRDRLLPLVPVPRKQELEDYYNLHREEFSKLERREMFLIDLPVAAFLDPRRRVSREDEQAAVEKSKKSAEEASEELKQGRPFEDVARKYSQGLHTDEGGNWGFITQASAGEAAPMQGHWEVPSKRLFTLAPGETSEIIEAAHSFFIVKVGRIEPGKKSTFQEAQPEIANAIRQQRFNKLRTDFLQKQLDQSTIGSLDDFVRAVLNTVPGPKEANASVAATDGEAIPSRSPPLKTDPRKQP